MDWLSYIAMAVIAWCALCIGCSIYILVIARKELMLLRRKKAAPDFAAAVEGDLRRIYSLNGEAAE